MEFVFVMLINSDPLLPDWRYIGNFESCDRAELYVALNHPNKLESRCLHKEYIYLPEGFEFVNQEY